MSRKRSNPDFVNGVPELLILRLLSRLPMHGYELVQAIRTCTGQALDFGEGCVYPILHRLESERLLSSRREVVNGRSRYVYRVTDKGRRQLADSTAAWQRIVEAVNQVLQGERHEPAPVL